MTDVFSKLYCISFVEPLQGVAFYRVSLSFGPEISQVVLKAISHTLETTPAVIILTVWYNGCDSGNFSKRVLKPSIGYGIIPLRRSLIWRFATVAEQS